MNLLTIDEELLARALETPQLIISPLPAYGLDRLDYGMTIGIEVTPMGRLWACWVGGGDNESAFFVLARSEDRGKTWSDPCLVIDPHDQSLPCARSSLVGALWTDPSGRLLLFFDQSLAHFDGRAGVWSSICSNPDDDEPTWSEPRRIWHGMTLNKPIVYSNGEWLLPISLWGRRYIDPRFNDCFHELDDLRQANLFVSRDKGQTWQMRGGVRFPFDQFDEHMVVELADGRLWMLARTSEGVWESRSDDAGKTWAAPAPSAIQQINSRFHIRRLHSGRLLLVKHGLTPQNRTDQRSHLTAFLSDDDGSSWSAGLLLDERSGISYPDCTQAADHTLFISYDRNRIQDGEILLARITETDIMNGCCSDSESALRLLISRPLGISR